MRASPFRKDFSKKESFLQIPCAGRRKLLGLGESILNGGLDAFGGHRGAADAFNAFNAVLGDDFRDHRFDRSGDDHVGFAVLENLDGSDLAAGNVDLNLNLGFAALAFARLGAVLVGGGLGAGGNESGSGNDDKLLHHDVNLCLYWF